MPSFDERSIGRNDRVLHELSIYLKFLASENSRLTKQLAMLVLLVVNIVNRKIVNRENRLVTVPFRAARVSN